ncbi:MAG: ABC-F family ATP-binding cassette domain-containing protein [Gemmatimonadaceae bacterium]
MTLLAINNVGVDFGATTLLKDVSFTVGEGERWGIIGRNGTGKTTLFRLITGEMAPTRGVVSRPNATRVSLLEQHRNFGDATTVWEAAAGAFADLFALERSITEQANRMSESSSEAELERYGRDLERFERQGGYMIAPRIDAVLDGLGFNPEKARVTALKGLSGGERGRLALAGQLVSPADILLLDEPTNHLDIDTTRWLEQYLRDIPSTIILVSHDRAFLSAVVDHVLHVEGLTAFAYAGSYESFVEQRNLRRLTQLRTFEQQKRVIAQEEDYIARNLAGQNSKQAKGRRKRLERTPRLSAPIGGEPVMSPAFKVRDRGGDRVMAAEQVRIDVGDRTLIKDFSATLMRGDVVGLIGPNGAGKTTLIRVLLEEHPIAGGVMKLGGGIDAGYYRQDLSQLPLERTIYETISALRPLWERGAIQGHLGRFEFSGDEVQRRVGSLSGGERARLALAILMLGGSNLLILDEPTNHLDVESIEAIEDAVSDYDGSVLLVSHDRALLRALTTRVWVLHEKRIIDFAGGYEEWELAATERLHAARVRAAESEARHRVHERQAVERPHRPDRDKRASARKAREHLAAAEVQVAELEKVVDGLTTTLDDPGLYTTPDGTHRATMLGKQLESSRTELDAAIAAWEKASAEVDESVE